MNLYEKPDEDARRHVEELGALHGSQGLKIPDHLYDLWLESLLVAVSECDPHYDASLADCWREVMLFGINLMRSSGRAAAGDPPQVAGADAHEAPDMEKLKHVIRTLEQLSKEAAHRSNLEKDTEAMAFQFGQYRAYLHASEMLVGLLKKKPAF